MPEKEIQIQIKMVPKNASLEEEFYHCITYLVQQFACYEDARDIEALLNDNRLRNEFMGKNTKITFKKSVNI